jgi:hypothetical protein
MTKLRNIYYHYLSFLFIAAYAIKALVPSGFMPAVNQHGMAELVICSGNGFEVILVDRDKIPFPVDEDHNNAGHSHDVCPYAPVLSQSAAGEMNSPVVIRSPLPFFVSSHVQLLPNTTTYKDWSSRAPPFFS